MIHVTAVIQCVLVKRHHYEKEGLKLLDTGGRKGNDRQVHSY